MAAQRLRQRHQKLHIASAAARAAHGDRGFAARQQHAGRRERLGVPGHLQGDGAQHAGHLARFALDRIGQYICAQTHPRRGVGGRVERHPRRGQTAHGVLREGGVAGFGRLARAGFEMRADRVGQVDRVACEHRQRVGAGGGVGQGGAGGDQRRVVARHIRNQPGDQPRRRAGPPQPAALERGEVFAHAVDFANRSAAGEQRAAELLLVFEGDPGRRQREQRRSAAGDQRQHEVVFGQPGEGLVAHALRRVAAARVGHRVGGFDDLNVLARHAVAVAGDDQPADPSAKGTGVALHRRRHRGRGLARADHHQPAADRRQAVDGRGNALRRVGGGECGVEQGGELFSGAWHRGESSVGRMHDCPPRGRPQAGSRRGGR